MLETFYHNQSPLSNYLFNNFAVVAMLTATITPSKNKPACRPWHGQRKTPHLAMRGRGQQAGLESSLCDYLILMVAVPWAPVTSNESPDFLPAG